MLLDVRWRVMAVVATCGIGPYGLGALTAWCLNGRGPIEGAGTHRGRYANVCGGGTQRAQEPESVA